MGGMRIIRYILAAILLGMTSFGVFFYRTGGFGATSYRALQWSTENKHHALTSLLLVLGAPPSPKKSMLDWHYFSALTDTPLHTAAKDGETSLVDALLIHGASVDWCCCACVTPLHHAILSGNIDIVERLLRAGARTDIGYEMGPTALELAQSRGKLEIVELITAHNKTKQLSRPVD